MPLSASRVWRASRKRASKPAASAACPPHPARVRAGRLEGLARRHEPRRHARARGEGPEYSTEISAGRGPLERHALAGIFHEGVAIGGDRVLQLRRPTLALAEGLERIAEIVLCRSPVERRALPRAFS